MNLRKSPGISEIALGDLLDGSESSLEKKDILQNKIAGAAVLAMVVIFSILRLVSLDADFPGGITHSSALYSDEGWYNKPAISLQTAGTWHIKDDFDQAINLPGLSVVQAVMFTLFGMSLCTARLTISLFFFGMLASLFFFLRMYSSGRAALIAITLISTNFVLFAYSRLALLEIPMLSLVSAAVLFAGLYSMKRKNTYLFLSILAFSWAILTKTTATFAIVVITYVLSWRAYENNKMDLSYFVKIVALYCFGAALLVMGYYGYILLKYRSDFVQFYFLVFGKKTTALGRLLPTLRNLIEETIYFQLVLYPITILTGLYLLIFKRACENKRVLIAFFGWTVIYLIQLSTIHYHPPRYFLPVVVSLSVCAACILDQLIINAKEKASGILLIIFLACAINSVAANCRKDVSYLIHPNYSFSTMCREVRERMKSSQGEARPLLLGNFANTISLATGIPSINECDAAITLDERVQRFLPTHYVTLGPVEKEIAATLLRHYNEVRPAGKWDCFDNYIDGQPVFLWELIRSPATAGGHARGKRQE